MKIHLTLGLVAKCLIAAVMVWPLVASAGDATPEPSAQGVEASVAVATVNGESILLEDLERRLQTLHGSATGTERHDFDIDRLMFGLINDTLIAQEARALGLADEEPVRGKVEELREELALRLMERDEISDLAIPTEEQIRKLFEERYRRVTLQVVTAYEREEAEAMRQRLVDGADMAQMAEQASVDPYALRGGHLESLPRRDIQPDIANLAFSLEPGELGGPVRTDLGWSVLRVESFQPADSQRFEALRGTLEAIVRGSMAAARRSELAQAARERMPVEVNQELVTALVPVMLPDGRWAPEVKEPDEVVARIGSVQTIRADEYGKALFRRWSGVRNEEAAVASAPLILQRMLEQRLLLAEALERGYGQRPEVKRELRAYEQQLLVPRYLEEVVATDIEVGTDEMRAHFEEHKETFGRPPQLAVSQITVPKEEVAEEVARLLGEGTDPAWLAERHSVDRFKGDGGDRGWISPRPGSDEVSNRLLEASPGDVVGPFGSRGNYVVLLVRARRDQGTYDFEEVSGNVREAVFSRKLQEDMHNVVTTLRSRSDISINDKALADLGITATRGEATPEEGASGHGG